MFWLSGIGNKIMISKIYHKDQKVQSFAYKVSCEIWNFLE